MEAAGASGNFSKSVCRLSSIQIFKAETFFFFEMGVDVTRLTDESEFSFDKKSIEGDAVGGAAEGSTFSEETDVVVEVIFDKPDCFDWKNENTLTFP